MWLARGKTMQAVNPRAVATAIALKASGGSSCLGSNFRTEIVNSRLPNQHAHSRSQSTLAPSLILGQTGTDPSPRWTLDKVRRLAAILSKVDRPNQHWREIKASEQQPQRRIPQMLCRPRIITVAQELVPHQRASLIKSSAQLLRLKLIRSQNLGTSIFRTSCTGAAILKCLDGFPTHQRKDLTQRLPNG